MLNTGNLVCPPLRLKNIIPPPPPPPPYSLPPTKILTVKTPLLKKLFPLLSWAEDAIFNID